MEDIFLLGNLTVVVKTATHYENIILCRNKTEKKTIGRILITIALEWNIFSDCLNVQEPIDFLNKISLKSNIS